MKKKFNPNQLVLDLFGVEKATTVNESHIRDFKRAYWAIEQPRGEYIRNEMSDEFIKRLAREAAEAKTGLREMMSRSPHWSDALQAWILPFNTQVPVTPEAVRDIILDMWRYARSTDAYDWEDIYHAARYFLPGGVDENSTGAIEKITGQAPRLEMKKSKVFMKLSKALGVYTNEHGSQYQFLEGQLFTALAAPFTGEVFLVPKKGKLFVSINPAHFLSMSNPKHYDSRKNAMVSCHSLNGDGEYRSGCSGYARDKTSIIAFTAARGEDALLNRKTSRQVFFYQDGALVQSRLYTTDTGCAYGGVGNGEHWQYTVFRELIQGEISRCERRDGIEWTLANYRQIGKHLPPSEIQYRNSWGLRLNQFGVDVKRGVNFGGYIDWEEFANLEGMIRVSVRKDKLNESGQWIGCNKPIIAGAAGLHVMTAKTIRRGESISA